MIASISSDFCFIADYCVQILKSTKEKGKANYDPPVHWRMDHPEETFMTLAAFSLDKDLGEVFYKLVQNYRSDPQKGELTMESVVAHIEERGFLKAEQLFQEELSKKERQFNEKEQQWEHERGGMISDLVLGAQRLTKLQDLTAEQACDEAAEKTRVI